MPFYEISYAIPLTQTQKDTLASAITTIHSTNFNTPKNFVNVRLTDDSAAETYIAGKRRQTNHIRALVRTGPTRTQEMWEKHCLQIQDAWDEIVVRNSAPRPKGKGEDADLKLRSMVVVGGFVGGLEAGFVLPPAGGDMQWLHENWGEFNRLAEGGDREWKDMVDDINQRGLMDGTNGVKV